MRSRTAATALTTLTALALVTGALGGAAQARPVAHDADGRPNILMVMTDDQALADVELMPHVERLLAAKGTSFQNMVTSFPLCCPSRATVLTGQYAHNHGVAGNFYPNGWQGLKRKHNTLGVWLQRAGYRTAMIGKWLNGYGALDRKEVPPGFTIWRGLLDLAAYDYFNFVTNADGRLRWRGDRDYANALVELARLEAEPPGVENVGELLAAVAELFTPGDFGTAKGKNYTIDVTAKMTRRIVRAQRHARKPFFVWWAPAAPHREDVNGAVRGFPPPDPRPPPRYAERSLSYELPRPPSFDVVNDGDPALIAALPPFTPEQISRLESDFQGRIGSLLAVDEQVKRLLRTLRKTHQLRNTVIVFVSDNGWVQGPHRIAGDKFVPYEESLLVPFIIRGPGIARDREVSRQVANVDIAPTLLDLAGAKAGRTPDGVSLLGATRNRVDLPHRALDLEATGPLFLAEGFPMKYDQPYVGVRTQRYKYVEWSYGSRELYDLKTDPYELDNHVDDPAYAAVQARMLKLLAKLRACKGHGCQVAP